MNSKTPITFDDAGKPKVAVSHRETSAPTIDAYCSRGFFARRLITRSVMATLASRQVLGLFGLILVVHTALSEEGARGDTFPLTSAVPHSVPEPLRPKLQTLAQQHADKLYKHLLSQTDQVDRVCRLTDAQTSRLKLAAKGAVQHAVDDWLASIAKEYAADPRGPAARLLTTQIQGRNNARGVAEFKAIGDRRVVIVENGRVVGFGQGEIDEVRQRAIIVDGVFRGFGSRPAKDQKMSVLDLDPEDFVETSIWQATLERLLTDDQRAWRGSN